MAAAPGSLADYDIVLSISEEAINRQLGLLYSKKITTTGNPDDLPPPTPLEGGGAAAPSTYLINHDLEIHVTDTTGELDKKTGIFGHIECPTVSFTNVKQNDHRRVRVSFKFKRDESKVEPAVVDPKDVVPSIDCKDSMFWYWVVKGRTAIPTPQIINGWTMSWEARIGRRDIQDIMQGKQFSLALTSHRATTTSV